MKGNLNIEGPLSLIHSITEQFSRLSMEHIRSVSLCFCLNTKKQTRATNKAQRKNKSSETFFLFFSSSQLESREHKGVTSPGPNELDQLFFFLFFFKCLNLVSATNRTSVSSLKQTVCYFRSPTIWPVLSGVETDRQTAERRGVFSMYSHLSARINFCSVQV